MFFSVPGLWKHTHARSCLSKQYISIVLILAHLIISQSGDSITFLSPPNTDLTDEGTNATSVAGSQDSVKRSER